MTAKKLLQRTSIGVILFWAGLFIYFCWSGRIDRYVDVSFRTWAMVAGLGLAVLALFNLLTANAKMTCGHDHEHDHDHDCGHDHDHHHEEEHETHDHELSNSSLLTAILILLVPMLMAANFSEDRFSAGYVEKWGRIETKMQQQRLAAKREAIREQEAQGKADAERVASVTKVESNPYSETDGVETSASSPPETEKDESEWGAFTIDDLKEMVPQNDNGDFLLDVTQLFYTAGDDELMSVLEGLSVETTAQLMAESEEDNPDGNRLRIFRLFIECCAADARPLSIPIEFTGKLPPYTEMGWYILKGKVRYNEKPTGEVETIITVEELEETTEPTDMMMF